MAETVTTMTRPEPALPDGWVIAATHTGRFPNLDLIYEPDPHHHRVRVWLNARSAPVAPWLGPILVAIAAAPILIETHVWADR